MPDDMNLDNTTPEEENVEPVGAQVLRRIHQDHSILMQEYDEMMEILEHEGVKTHLQKLLEAQEATLSATEELFSNEYSHLEGLEGAGGEETKALEEGGEEEAADDADEAEDVEEDVEADTDAEVSADSDEEEEVTGDEALEGMETKQLTPAERKALRGRYSKHLNGKVKSACPECGKEPCVCDKAKALCTSCKKAGKSSCACGKGLKKDLTQEEAGEVQEELDDVGENLDSETADTEPTTDDKSLHPDYIDDEHRPTVTEAKDLLTELHDTSEFTDDHRMKAYHSHRKMMDINATTGDVGVGVGGVGIGMGGDGEQQKSIPGDPAWAEEEGNEPQHQMKAWHKNVEDAGSFLKEVSETHPEAYSTDYRERASHHASELGKALAAHDALGASDVSNSDKERLDEEPSFEPGELGQKAADDEEKDKKEKAEKRLTKPKTKTMEDEEKKHLKHVFAKQQEALKNLNRKMAALSKL